METSANITSMARVIAVAQHQDQRYGDGQPYITHLRAVVRNASAAGGDDEQVAIAWLHDTLEDTELTEADMRLIFGNRVADAVVAMNPAGRRAGNQALHGLHRGAGRAQP